jgi:hypothetical protein
MRPTTADERCSALLRKAIVCVANVEPKQP